MLIITSQPSSRLGYSDLCILAFTFMQTPPMPDKADLWNQKESAEMMERDFEGQVIKDIVASISVPFDYSGGSHWHAMRTLEQPCRKTHVGRNWTEPPTNRQWGTEASCQSSVTGPSLKQILQSQQSCQVTAVFSNILSATTWETAKPESQR